MALLKKHDSANLMAIQVHSKASGGGRYMQETSKNNNYNIVNVIQVSTKNNLRTLIQ